MHILAYLTIFEITKREKHYFTENDCNLWKYGQTDTVIQFNLFLLLADVHSTAFLCFVLVHYLGSQNEHFFV